MSSWQKISQKKLLSGPEKIRAVALRYLARRHYSAAGLKQKLLERCSPEHVEEMTVHIDQTIAELCQERLINEEKMVEAWVYYRQEHAVRSASFVQRELVQKGVDPDIVRDGLAQLYDEDKEDEVLLKAFLKEAAKKPPQQEKQEIFWQNLVKRLARKGFSLDKIIDVVNKKRD
ncbi:MAG: regulatory protein RecX [Bacillota bacterium]